MEELYEFTLSDGTDVSIMSPVFLTLAEAAPGSYPDGAEGPVIDVDGSLGPGQSVTITLANDAGFPAGIAVLHNDGGPYWEPIPTDISVDQKTLSATLTSLSPVGLGIPVEDIELTFDELAAFHGETVTVEYTVSPANATEKAVNLFYSGWAAEATDAVDDDGEIEVEFVGEGYGEITIQSQYEPAMISFDVLTVRDVSLSGPAISCRVRPDPLEAGENYYYVDGLTAGNLYVAFLDDLSGVDREVVAAITTVDPADQAALSAEGYVERGEGVEEPLVNYYVTNPDETALLVFRPELDYQFFVVTDGSEASNLDFTFDLSVGPYAGNFLRIETFAPSGETNLADTSMAVLVVENEDLDVAGGAFDVSESNTFTRLFIDESSLSGCIIAVAGQTDYRETSYDPRGKYAVLVTSTVTGNPSVAGDYTYEHIYEMLDEDLINGEGLCAAIGGATSTEGRLSNPGTRVIETGDTDLMESEADFMWFDP